jgi:hypothetical protein
MKYPTMCPVVDPFAQVRLAPGTSMVLKVPLTTRKTVKCSYCAVLEYSNDLSGAVMPNCLSEGRAGSINDAERAADVEETMDLGDRARSEPT